MPFSGISDPKLPDHVKGLSADKRRQWVGAWNGAFEDCDGDTDECEGRAFRIANAAVKELNEMGEDTRTKEEGKKNVDFWQMMDRQIPQDEAEYTVDGGLRGEPCATCRWFVSPNGCLIVENWPLAIGEIGHSNRWEAVPTADLEPEPVPVMIVEEGSSEKQPPPDSTVPSYVPLKLFGGDPAHAKVIQMIKEIGAKTKEWMKAGDKGNDEPLEGIGFKFFKDDEGNLRYVVRASNRWRDNDKPSEIFEEKAHKEFVQYLEDGGDYPEAWLWHTPGTRWANVDWADYSDGFLFYSGTVDRGMEHVAEFLANEKGIGVSHGYRYRHSDAENGIIGWYRDYEWSPLYSEKAANAWTGIDLIVKEANKMGFTDAKREFLVKAIGEDKVAALEQDTDGLKQALEAAGIEWKDIVDDEPPADEGAKTDEGPNDDDREPEPVPAVKEIDYDLIGQKAAEAVAGSEAFKGVLERLDKLEQGMKEVQAEDEAKLRSVFAPRTMDVINGFVASKDDDNVVAEGNKASEYAQSRAPVNPAFAVSILGGDNNREP